ncbi:MAG: redox-sensing transcriptional repressor Rex [Thermotogaceae bacterium]|nr:redox-sensing transcriptional repressor Rex [Thermotogaceae bacterium]
MKIPKPAIRRLAVYYRCLQRLKEEGKEKTSSKELAQRLGIKACQIRKDLSYFGEFGKRGVGYNIDNLLEKLKAILGLESVWKAIVIGAGNLGKAIAGYKGIKEQGFDVVALFDVDGRKVGKKVNEAEIHHMDDLEEFVKENNVKIAVICVPKESAQQVAEAAEKAGVEGILNFAPTVINVSVPVENVDIAVSLKSLTFQIIRRKGKEK